MKKLMWRLFRYPKRDKYTPMWEAYIDDKERRKVRGRMCQ